MRVKVILNPYANRWGAGAQAAATADAFRAAGVACDLVVTESPGQGTPLAAAATRDGYEAVVAAGGDGTINEVINGLISAAGDGPTVPFGIIPLGTANDFNLMAGLPDNIGAAVGVIAAGRTRRIDAGQVNGRFFINNSAAAMEPMVTLENIKMKRLSGEVRYVVALLRALTKLKPWRMNLAWDGGGYEGPAYLLSVCNSPRTGGFTMAPGASIDDGLLDMVFAPQVSKGTVIAILLKLMKGEHINHPAVTFQRVTAIDLTSTPGTPLHSDGEIFTESATVVSYRVLPGKVTLLTP
ncbi:MAG: diacylglycerol kinase family lipid kinase [Anaerolineae bacterium]|uniref:diacylglycerol/lipid kinase family protein n=1 Tax=Promineifilum sp. TaxID=2664178 RepID=UPI001D46DA47|nr:diacylglycerol kinase family lipid kinase [Anaerolineales bacterium]MCB8935997.1 diacylglycerol kinase family lipid kinase [Promineifilum sp.]MCO5181599.1 diacylglycerol kinase family lipid kinase [Promineifilum sp.]MCW5846442.1 diacylglycerol kinase family lipid kinase [Anaerolineae bacterium]